jgi:hypothetical protein
VIDANINTISEHIPPRGIAGGALLAATGSIWLIAENSGTLLRLRSTSATTNPTQSNTTIYPHHRQCRHNRRMPCQTRDSLCQSTRQGSLIHPAGRTRRLGVGPF